MNRTGYAFKNCFLNMPGTNASIPPFLRNISGYNGQIWNGTEFPDWRSKDLMQTHLQMYSDVAQKYDNDPRVFCVQTGFGFWSEYHIYGKSIDYLAQQ